MARRLSGVEPSGPDDRNFLQFTDLSDEFFLASKFQGVLLTFTFKGFCDLGVDLISDTFVLDLHFLHLLGG